MRPARARGARASRVTTAAGRAWAPASPWAPRRCTRRAASRRGRRSRASTGRRCARGSWCDLEGDMEVDGRLADDGTIEGGDGVDSQRPGFDVDGCNEMAGLQEPRLRDLALALRREDGDRGGGDSLLLDPVRVEEGDVELVLARGARVEVD